MIKLIHLSKKRARFRIHYISKKIDPLFFLQQIDKFDGITDSFFNLKISTLTIKFNESFNIKKFIEFLNLIEEKETSLKICLKPNFEVKEQNLSNTTMVISFLSLFFNIIVKSNPLVKFITVTASLPILISASKELINKGVTSRVLEGLAIFISLYRKDYLAANGTNVLIGFGEFMEESMVNKSDDLIKELAKPTIKNAWIIKNLNGKENLVQIEADELKAGDIVVVGSGDIVPVDGHIVEGKAYVNQASMTGESDIVEKKYSDSIISGSVVENGNIKIWAEYVGQDTALSKIKKYMQSSLQEKSQTGLKASHLADKLIPVTLSFAFISYLFKPNALASVLQADYSCALKLPTPTAFKSSISKAGKNGILIKGAKSLEILSQADTFVFDKTGTLTGGKLEIVHIKSFDSNISQTDLLNLAASAEEHYFHPIAKAIVEAANKRGFIHIHHDEVEFIVSHGVKTTINKKQLIIGSRHFLEDDEKIDFSNYKNEINDKISQNLAILYIAYDNKLIGIIALSDKIRDNCKQTISNLKKIGVKEIIMLTGDTFRKAELIANELGIDKFYSDMLPTQKADILDMLKKDGKKIAYIGDGINDAPSLIKADVGISMQTGAHIAKASADIALLKDDLNAIYEAKKLSNDTMKLINRNFNVTLLANSVILFGAGFGFFSPILTAFLHNGTTIVTLLNSIKGVKFANK